MDFPTDWDLDYYRTDYESDEHWELRRSFMEMHKESFPEDELVCLAQVFTNVEFLGCKYPDETMRKVAMLSKDVAKNFRNSRANRLKRTFVGAADAAGAKVKGRFSTGNNTNKPIQFVASHLPNIRSTQSHFDDNEEPPNKQQKKCDAVAQKPPALNHKNYTHLFNNIYGNLIIYEPINTKMHEDQKSFQILNNITTKQKVKMDIEFKTENTTIHCNIKINSILVGDGSNETKKIARTFACDKALKKLKKHCYTIKMVSDLHTKIDTSNRDKLIESNETNASNEGSSLNTKISSENKGFKMMKMLGWTGGALSAGGLEEPVSVQLKVDRKGLGLTTSQGKPLAQEKEFKRYFGEYLRDYSKNNENVYELVFSKDYSKEERAILHQIARQYGLKSNSKNTADGERYLIVSKKFTYSGVANNILNKGIYCDIYELISPDVD